METITAIFVEPGKPARLIEIENTFQAKRSLVEGDIEISMPFEDQELAIVSNDSAKLKGLELNRAIFDENRQLIDIIAGKFLLCYQPLTADRFASFPEETAEKYLELFECPHVFSRTAEGGITITAHKPA